ESEEADVDYISDTENLDDLLQYNDRDLEIEKMFNFNTFLEEKTNETTNSNVELGEDELDYDIDEIINASTSKV
ncbi:5643_t:CDS:1, partial [Racocetra fulgida]